MNNVSRDREVQVEVEGVGGRILDIAAGRRAFLRSVGIGVAAAALIGGAGGVAEEAHAATLTDAQILNFALNLEYLEAEFYLIAAFGRRLADDDTTGVGTRGRLTGGRQVNFAPGSDLGEYAKEIATDEEAHVKFLRAALGNASVARPAINIGSSFAVAAKAAGLGDGFDAYASENNFALAAFIFEDVGVTAYKGAARFIENKDVLEAAAGILAVEAYHAGTIRAFLYARRLFVPARRISDLRDAVDSPEQKDQGLVMGNMANIVPTNPNGIAYSRSPREVLNIVYLGKDADQGGFFPQGLNGALR